MHAVLIDVNENVNKVIYLPRQFVSDNENVLWVQKA